MADGTLIFDTKIDQTGFDNGVKSLAKTGASVVGSFVKLGVVLGGALAVGLGKKAVDIASDLQEVQNVVDVSFGNMANKMEDFAKTSLKAYGLSQLEAKRTGSTFMAMARGIGVAEESASDMSLALTGLAGDMASFFNKKVEDTSSALKSIFTGNTIALTQYGIVMTATNLEQFRMEQGITKSYKAMTQAEKVQLRYNYVMSQTALAQGDFARTSGSWANQVKLLNESFKQFLTIIGNGLMKALTPAMQVLNAVVGKLIDFANALSKIFGGSQLQATQQQAQAIQGATEAEEELEDAVKGVDKANKKSIAGFDTIMQITENTASAQQDTLDGGDFGISSLPVSDIEESAEAMGMFDDIDLSKLTESLQKLGDALSRFGGNIWDGIKWGFDNIIKPLAKFTITEVLPRFFDSLSLALERANTIIEKVAPIMESWYTNVIKPLGEFAGEKLLAFWDKWNKANERFNELMENSEVWNDLKRIWKALEPIALRLGEAIITIVDWLANLVVDQAMIDLENWWKNFEDVVGLVADLLDGDFKGAGNHFKELVWDNSVEHAQKTFKNWKNKIEEVGKAIASNFTKEKMDEAFFNIGVSFGEAMAKVIEWKQKLSDWIENDVKPLFTKEYWLQVIDGIKTSFSETVEDVKSWFTLEKWKEVGNNVYNGLANGINKAIDGLQKLVNAVIGFFNKIIDGYNSVAEKVGMAEINNIAPVNFSQYKVPKLATGTVIPANHGEFMAMLGDNKRETEVVSPMSTIKEALIQALQEYGTQELVADVVVNWNGEEVYNQIEKVKARRGTKLVRGGMR